MDTTTLSIATITWVRNANEEELLRAALQQLAKLNIPVFITDGGSGEGFLSFLRSFPQFNLLQADAKGVWAQARNSLHAAYQSGSRFIFYTEPDKHNFFVSYLPGMLSEIFVDERSGIVLASRLDEAFSTFPPFQQMTETAINNCCSEITGQPFDFTYGPFLLNSRLMPFLDLVHEDIGWGWRPFMFGIAARLGYKLEAHKGDYSCPPDQRQDNPSERIYRMRQLTQNIQGLTLSTSLPLNNASDLGTPFHPVENLSRLSGRGRG